MGDGRLSVHDYSRRAWLICLPLGLATVVPLGFLPLWGMLLWSVFVFLPASGAITVLRLWEYAEIRERLEECAPQVLRRYGITPDTVMFVPVRMQMLVARERLPYAWYGDCKKRMVSVGLSFGVGLLSGMLALMLFTNR